MIVSDFLFDDSGAAHRLELDGVALGDVFHQARLRVGSPRSAPVACATTVASNCSRNSRRILAMRRSASFDNFCAAARPARRSRSRARGTRSRGTKFRASPPSRESWTAVLCGPRMRAAILALQLLFAELHASALGFQFAQVGVQAIEKAPDILRLRAQSRARRCDDGGIQSEPLRDVDAGGSAGTPIFSS